ncbi:hypothetical protein BH23BAC4_BH23BAC4_13320 [soil metagenome]
MWPHRLSVAALLVDGRTAYENALSTPETALALAERGYTEPVIADDLEQIEALERLLGDQIMGRAAASTLVRDFQEEWDDFHSDVYIPHVEMARRLFKRNPTAWMRLGLRGKRAEGLAAWLDQARRFYDNAIAGHDLHPVLALRGITLDELETARGRLEALATAASEKEDSKGLAAKTTEEAVEARTDVADRLTAFQEVARILFRDRPWLLTTMGIRRHRQRGRPRNQPDLDLDSDSDSDPDLDGLAAEPEDG